MNGEDTRIQLLREILEGSGSGETYIGDDAAVLPWAPGSLLVSIDAQVEGTHFQRNWCTPEDIGYRSLMAAASDLAAMGATPRGFVAALTLPPDFSDDDLRGLAIGQKTAADELGSRIIGGNLARGRELSIATTVLGSAARPLTRSGAMPGDGIYIAGPLGLARAGLRSFESGIHVASARAAFCRPRARIAEGLAAVSASATACMDVSDGLAEDAARLAAASNVSLWFESALLLALSDSELHTAACALGDDVLDLAVRGGEDYALLATGAHVPAGFLRVGTVREASRNVEDTRVFVDGRSLTLRGFSHFG